MNSTPHIVTFTGHRSYNRRYDSIISANIKELYSIGARRFRVGMAEGFDLAAACVILDMANLHHDIELELFIPWPGFAATFKEANRRLYDIIIRQATLVHYIATDYYVGLFQQRNEAMVDGADIVIAWWNGKPSGTANTIRYARTLGCRIKNIFDNQQLELEL